MKLLSRSLCTLILCMFFPFAFAQQSGKFANTPMGIDDARFFLERTGFASAERDVMQYAGLNRRQAVERVLAQEAAGAQTLEPSWVAQPITPPRDLKSMNDDERKAYREQQIRQAFELRGWWLHEMLTTPSPLSERMTLFWHNHFVSSQQKVHYTQLMYRQNLLLRRNALGNFGSMLHEVSRDPAMLIYLDGAKNRKGAPNENFAREVMELFTLGEGHYSEQDIKEAARAYTGWSIDPENGEYKWRPFAHDDGIKTVLGKSGNFNGDDVLDILLAQPACAEFIVGKLWREFVSPDPDPVEVKRIAARFRDSGYEIKVALRELFLSPAFWSAKNRATLVKSPVELVVGTLRQFDFGYDDPLPFTFAVAQLGQNLFDPPNVKGWPGGDDWINSSTLLARKSVLERLFRAIDPAGRPQMAAMRRETQELGKVKGQGALREEGRIRFANVVSMIAFDPESWLRQFGAQTDTAPDVAQRLAIQKAVLPLEPSVPIRADLAGVAYLRTLVMDPTYQLK
ncbi:MAG: DUF1800 domain-containing protein [Proteobacteria bacterium]|nr:DUF1800 domain-containing protein [Pseudomonadota bacterium]